MSCPILHGTMASLSAYIPCPNGFEEIIPNSGWCIEQTTDATAYGILALAFGTMLITYILSTANWKKIWKKLKKY